MQLDSTQNILQTIKLKKEEGKSLTMNEIKTLAPTVATEAPSAKVRGILGLTEKYVHVPTTQVIEDIMSMGWEVTDAVQVKVRNKTKNAGYQKHMITFVNRNFIQEDSTESPQLLLTNSHDGACSFRLEVGIFRLVCSNGMVIKSKDFGSMKVRHMGYDFETISAAVKELMENVPGYLESVEKMKEKQLNDKQLIEFAKKAAMIRFEKETEETIDKVVDMQDLLAVERKEDSGSYLWEVFNRVQEKVINGTFQYQNRNNKVRKARPIKGFQQNVKVNQDLWELAEEFVS